MFLFLTILIILPLAELYVIIKVADWLGVGNAIGILVIISLLGIILLRFQGFNFGRRVMKSIFAGKLPTDTAINGLLSFIGCILLIFPGFITDIIGLLFLFPPTRILIQKPVKKRLITRLRTSKRPYSQYYDVDATAYEQSNELPSKQDDKNKG